MTLSESQKVIDAVIKGISVSTNLESSEIGIDDNLEIDLYLNISTDIPAIISNVSQELDLEIQVESITEFMKQASREPEDTTVASMVALFEEEVEFN